MKRSGFETILGAIVICVAATFFFYSYDKADLATESGYQISANFSSIGGLKEGDNVVISGVKIGQVDKVELNPETYLAEVTLHINNDISLPTDTAAAISSESLLGGLYLSLEPGADEEMLEDGDSIEYTQAPQNLEQLLGQFIFSMQDNKNEEAKD